MTLIVAPGDNAANTLLDLLVGRKAIDRDPLNLEEGVRPRLRVAQPHADSVPACWRYPLPLLRERARKAILPGVIRGGAMVVSQSECVEETQ